MHHRGSCRLLLLVDEPSSTYWPLRASRLGDGGTILSVNAEGLRSSVLTMLEAAWREPGYCVPNQAVYPHQWLWDSCFHSLIWLQLGSERARTEIETSLAHQGSDGFVPHMTYWTDGAAAGLWGRERTSSITQPPMYGHAIAQLLRGGMGVQADTVARAVAGIKHLLEDRPRTEAGLVPLFHPWESGCDDSPRWDDWLPDLGVTNDAKGARRSAWRETKSEMVAALEHSTTGAAVGSRRFIVGSIGFNALVAWNARELLDVVPAEASTLRPAVEELASTVAGRWEPTRNTWVDDGPESGRSRTLDAMLATLVDPRAEAFEELLDPAAFGAPYGPRGVHRAEPTYEPDVYWRGPAWPQLTYLMWVAARRAKRDDDAQQLSTALRTGAVTSTLAEFWNPESGSGRGAVPQSWAGLALVV